MYPEASGHCCRVQLGELLASALPVPQTLPIIKPSLLSSITHPQPPLPAPPHAPGLPSSTGEPAAYSAAKGSRRAAPTAPEPEPSSTAPTALAQGLGQVPAERPSAPGQVGPSGRSVPTEMRLEGAEEDADNGGGHLAVDKAKQALVAAARGVQAADYTTLQVVRAVCTPPVGRERGAVQGSKSNHHLVCFRLVHIPAHSTSRVYILSARAEDSLTHIQVHESVAGPAKNELKTCSHERLSSS